MKKETKNWLIGSSVKLQLTVLVIAAAVLCVVFSFSHPCNPSVQARDSALHQPESSLSYVHSQTSSLGTFAQEFEAYTATIVEADLVDDESGNKREIREFMPCIVPIRDSFGLYSVRAELLIVVQNFGSRNAVLLI